MNNSSQTRLHTLDSLRGIAAFIVLLTHCFNVWPDLVQSQMPWITHSPLRILLCGHSSVILFFVLSGYVLSLPFLHGKQESYLAYAIRRVCRIYIPFAFAILLAATLYYYSSKTTYGSLWFLNEWQHPPLTAHIVLLHLLMTGRSNDKWLNGVMWSLVNEMRISLIFPLIIILCRNARLAILSGIVLYIGATAAALALGNSWFMEADNFPETLILTVRYIPFFMIGIILAKNNNGIQNWINNISRIRLAALTVLALASFCIPIEIGNKKLLSIFPFLSQNGMKFLTDAALGISSGFLIVFARSVSQSPWPPNILNSSPAQWLGKISYSLYLVHLPIVFFLFRALLGKIDYWFIVLLTISISLPVAWLFYLVIERPSMRLGRNLAILLGRRAAPETETVQS